MKTLTALTLVALIGTAQLSAARPSNCDLTNLTPEQQLAFEELLERKVAIESESHLQRITILEEAEDCIQSIETLEAYKACEKSEAEARMALRASQEDDHKALRDDFKALISDICAAQ
ncbi:MAG: hypothetical protein JXK05_07160 [Campylobacterales bacterium]|nr:hypothetical protein [Campylobacterales bacterium]